MHGQVQVTMPNSKMNGTLITVDIGALGLAPPTDTLVQRLFATVEVPT